MSYSTIVSALLEWEDAIRDPSVGNGRTTSARADRSGHPEPLTKTRRQEIQIVMWSCHTLRYSLAGLVKHTTCLPSVGLCGYLCSLTRRDCSAVPSSTCSAAHSFVSPRTRRLDNAATMTPQRWGGSSLHTMWLKDSTSGLVSFPGSTASKDIPMPHPCPSSPGVTASFSARQDGRNAGGAPPSVIKISGRGRRRGLTLSYKPQLAQRTALRYGVY